MLIRTINTPKYGPRMEPLRIGCDVKCFQAQKTIQNVYLPEN